MSRIADYVLDYYPATGETRERNPIPSRAVEVKRSSPASAANHSGVGVIDWSAVESISPKEVTAFAEKYELGKLLSGNAKTNKPRPTGRLGKIKGLNLAPHFYANMLEQMHLKKSGALDRMDKEVFNAFNGRERNTASEGSGVPAKDLLDFCRGASPFCRQTCLVTTGQHATTLEASHAKMKFTYALLEHPELFVALLLRQLRGFAKTAQREGFDAVVRLNMLSDIPWYVVCPELFETLEGSVFFYDYTKVPYWYDPAYERVRHLLDLTFSYSGTTGNERLCAEALDAGERVAAVFAPENADRSTSVSTRTTWQEILASGLVKRGRIDLFGGRWPIVDGDESDYRIDDPSPAVVALNFKQPNITEQQAPHMKRALPESRARFTKKVPDRGHGDAYASARARRQMWAALPDAEVSKLLRRYPDAEKADGSVNPDKLPVAEVIRISDKYPPRRANPLEQVDEDETFGVTPRTSIPMAPIEGTNLLIGPHVPTVLND